MKIPAWDIQSGVITVGENWERRFGKRSRIRRNFEVIGGSYFEKGTVQDLGKWQRSAT